MRPFLRRLSFIVAAIAATPASAHPGHGHTPDGPQHYLIEPLHAIGWWGMIAFAVAAWLAWRSIPRLVGGREQVSGARTVRRGEGS